MKILVIFTGGTIGSVVQDGWIAPASSTRHVLINKYRAVSKDTNTEFEIISPYSILSENLSAGELNMLTECVLSEIEKDYDGIIVTHGTDTLQYTAAALSLSLGRCRMPVVLVSSAFPLENVKANGVENFRAAVSFIKSGAGRGVFVSYKNENVEAVHIHAASRVIAHAEAQSDVFSVDGEPYAFFKDGSVQVNFAYKHGETDKGAGRVVFCASPDILFIESRPGYGFSFLPDDCMAVIISPYHSGTLNTESEKFKAFCKKAKEKNIPVFVVNVKGGVSYKSSELFDELGLVVLPFCSKISIYVKCWMAVSLSKNVKEFVSKPIAEEFVV